ncbi:V-type ATPase [Ramaria rubella]|nr:V-type ATPase [Ramaria rubella]
MAAQQTQGIQTLLEAEKDAAKVVQQVRQHRVQRLKDARAEAIKEVEEYKKQKQHEHEVFESKHTGSTQNSQSQVDKDTDTKLAAIQKAYESHKEAVVEKLLDRIVLFKPELHRNLERVQR